MVLEQPDKLEQLLFNPKGGGEAKRFEVYDLTGSGGRGGGRAQGQGQGCMAGTAGRSGARVLPVWLCSQRWQLSAGACWP
jgi:hypothetical protein